MRSHKILTLSLPSPHKKPGYLYVHINSSSICFIRGKDDRLKAADFIAFGHRYHIPEKAVRTLLAQMTERAEAWVERIGEIGFDEAITERLQTEIRSRIRALGP